MILRRALPSVLVFFVTLLLVSPALGHNLWVETRPAGAVGQAHEVYVYFGEYPYGMREDIEDHRDEIGEIDLQLILPNGETRALETSIEGNRFEATFTPGEQGHYRVLLSATQAPVVDWREYDLGILKTHFFGTAAVNVANADAANAAFESVNAKSDLSIQPTHEEFSERQAPVVFQVTFKGELLAEHEVTVGYKDQWYKTLYTDEEGQVRLSFPWDGQYVIETVYTESAPGTFQGEEYEAVRHTATFNIPPTR